MSLAVINCIIIVSVIVIGIITCGIVLVSVTRAGIVILIVRVTHTDIIGDGLFLRNGLFAIVATHIFLSATL